MYSLPFYPEFFGLFLVYPFIPMGNQSELVKYNETKNINVTMFKHYLILIFAFIGWQYENLTIHNRFNGTCQTSQKYGYYFPVI